MSIYLSKKGNCMKEILLLANLGFSVTVPLVISIYISLYLKDLLNLPDTVVIFGIFIGIFTGVRSFCKIALNTKGSDKK